MKLGDRIKKYENCYRNYALTNSPLFVRVDGRAFHTITKKMEKPFDMRFIEAMKNTACIVSSEIQGFKCAYVQSDEITFLLTDYDTHETEGWFDYNISKIISITASLTSVVFYQQLILNGLHKQLKTIPVFDARAFNVPIDEITNVFLWRAKDWYRNSVQMAALGTFSHKDIHRKKLSELLEMLDSESVPWEDEINVCKNGTFVYKDCNTDIIMSTDTIKANYQEINSLIKEKVFGTHFNS